MTRLPASAAACHARFALTCLLVLGCLVGSVSEHCTVAASWLLLLALFLTGKGRTSGHRRVLERKQAFRR